MQNLQSIFKTTLGAVSAFALAVTLAGCGADKKEEAPAAGSETSAAATKGETVETGTYSVLVPDGYETMSSSSDLTKINPKGDDKKNIQIKIFEEGVTDAQRPADDMATQMEQRSGKVGDAMTIDGKDFVTGSFTDPDYEIDYVWMYGLVGENMMEIQVGGMPITDSVVKDVLGSIKFK